MPSNIADHASNATILSPLPSPFTPDRSKLSKAKQYSGPRKLVLIRLGANFLVSRLFVPRLCHAYRALAYPYIFAALAPTPIPKTFYTYTHTYLPSNTNACIQHVGSLHSITGPPPPKQQSVFHTVHYCYQYCLIRKAD